MNAAKSIGISMLLGLSACASQPAQPVHFAPGLFATEGPRSRETVTLGANNSPAEGAEQSREGAQAAVPVAANAFLAMCAEGLCQLDPATGQVVRQLTSERAAAATYTRSGDAILYFAEASREVRRFTLATAHDELVVSLANQDARCPGEAAPIEALSVYSNAEFIADGAHEALCVTLADGRENRRQTQIELRVDLRDNRIVAMQRFLCDDLNDQGSFPQCERAPLNARQSFSVPQERRRFFLDERFIMQASEQGARRGAQMPSGWDEDSHAVNWTLLTGNSDCAGACTRQLALLDSNTGNLYALPRTSEIEPGIAMPFGEPVAPSRLAEGRYAGLKIPTETSVWWLDERTIVVGELVIRAGESITRMPGALIPR